MSPGHFTANFSSLGHAREGPLVEDDHKTDSTDVADGDPRRKGVRKINTS
jgi:hypothetical protein